MTYDDVFYYGLAERIKPEIINNLPLLGQIKTRITHLDLSDALSDASTRLELIFNLNVLVSSNKILVSIRKEFLSLVKSRLVWTVRIYRGGGGATYTARGVKQFSSEAFPFEAAVSFIVETTKTTLGTVKRGLTPNKLRSIIRRAPLHIKEQIICAAHALGFDSVRSDVRAINDIGDARESLTVNNIVNLLPYYVSDGEWLERSKAICVYVKERPEEFQDVLDYVNGK